MSTAERIKLNFPIVADADQSVSKIYDMVHPELDAKITVRSQSTQVYTLVDYKGNPILNTAGDLFDPLPKNPLRYK